MKKWLVVLLAVAMVFAFAACAQESTDTPDTDATGDNGAAGDETAADDTVYSLKVNYYAADTIPPGKGMQLAADTAMENSNGRLQIATYYSGTYVSKADTMASLASGTIDIGLVEATQIGEFGEVNQVFNALLKEAPPTREEMTAVYRDMINTVPELNGDYAQYGIKWLSIFALGGYNLHGNTVVAAVEDIKGMKVEAHGDAAKYINALGGSGVELESSEYYNGLERSMVDAQMCHWAINGLFQIQELVSTHTIFGPDALSGGLYMPAMGYIINLNTWNSLPEDLQAVLADAFDQGGDYGIELDNPTYEAAVKYAEDKGDTFTYIDGADRGAWNAYMDDILNAWFDDCQKSGVDGEAVYNALLDKLAAL